MTLRAGAALALAVALAGCKHGAAGGHGPAAPPPSEVDGFRMGMSPAQSDARCAAAGHAVGKVDHDGPMTTRLCDGVEVAPGQRALVMLHFCKNDAVLCEIALVSTSADRAKPLFDAFRERTVAELGQPTDVNATNEPGDFAAGCPSKSAKLRWVWWWGTLSSPTGRVMLTLACENAKPSFGIYYDDAEGAAAQVAIAKASGALRR